MAPIKAQPQRHWVPSGVWKVFAHCHHNRSSTITAIIIITITCLGEQCHARYHESSKVQSDLIHKFKQLTLSICFEWLVDQIGAVGQVQGFKVLRKDNFPLSMQIVSRIVAKTCLVMPTYSTCTWLVNNSPIYIHMTSSVAESQPQLCRSYHNCRVIISLKTTRTHSRAQLWCDCDCSHHKM